MLGSLAATPATIPRACVPPFDTYNFCNPKLPLEKRLDDLISQLTLEEKPQLLIARNSPKGNISRLGIPEYDWGGNCIHGVQSRCSKDGRCPTSYPNPNALGATFNTSVWRGMGEVIGVELRSLWLQGVGENHDSNLPHIGLDCWSPNIGIVRDPRWGRNLETPSEDPAVCGSFGVEVTKGLQLSKSDPRFVQAVVTLKHFDANSLEGDWGPQGTITRHTVDSNISAFDLHDTYLPAFKQSVEQGGALGVMCSYNAINGVPSCANHWLLNETLRGAWNFSGYVTSDSGAVVDILKNHHYTSSWTETVAKAIGAGCDVESAPWPSDHAYGTGGPYIQYAPHAVQSGELAESALDAAVRNAVGLRFKLGLFDPIDDQPMWKVPPSEVQSDAHVAAAVDATAQSLVLLLNGGGVAGAAGAAGAIATDAAEGATAPPPVEPVLPFSTGGKVAVLGPHANDRQYILGNYLGQICSDAFGSVSCVETAYEAIAARNGAPALTTNATGCAVNSTDTSGFKAALDAANASDVVVFVGGLDTGSVEREGKDRKDVGLPGVQPALLRQLLALGKPVALVLFHGGIVTLPPDLLASPKLALVSAGYPGMYGAAAIAAALFDKKKSGSGSGGSGGEAVVEQLATNRWGKTPVTWFSEAGWKAADFDMLSFDMAKPPGRTHRYYTGVPQFAFGYGLSYSRTALHAAAKAATATTAAAGNGAAAVEVSVTNTDATRETDEVVFLYVSAARGTLDADEPAAKRVRALAAFERVGPIAPRGGVAKLRFEITPEMVAVHDAAGKRGVRAGAYTFVVSNGLTEVAVGFRCDKAACRADEAVAVEVEAA